MSKESDDKFSVDERIDSVSSEAKQSAKRGAIIACVIIFGALLIWFANNLVNHQSSDEREPIAEASSQERAYSVAQREQARTNFIQALNDFEQRFSVALDDPAILNFDTSAVNEIVQSKEKATINFASSAYIQALSDLDTAVSQAKSLQARFDKAFKESLSIAQEAFELEQTSQAQLALNRAFELKPNSQLAQDLQARLDALAPVQKAIESLRIAQAENNKIKQISALRAILSKDPARLEYHKQLDDLLAQQKNNQISQALEKGLSSLQQNDLVKAQQQNALLQKLAPNAPGVKEFAQQLQRQSKTLELQASIRNIENLAKQQQWQEVKAQSSLLLTSFAQDPYLRGINNKAIQILNIQSRLEQFIQRPHRLQDSNIYRQAKQALMAAVSVITDSQDVSNQVKQLSELMELATQKVSVEVLSDNKTNIRVLGVGNIGFVEQKIIELAPGSYRFEGKCEGFQSKIVTLILKPVESSAEAANQIKVVCDERI